MWCELVGRFLRAGAFAMFICKAGLFLLFKFILFVAVLDLGGCASSSLVAAGGAALWLGCLGFLLWVLSLQSVGSRAHGLQYWVPGL